MPESMSTPKPRSAHDAGYNGGPYFGLDYPFYSPVYSPGFLPPAPPVIGNGPGSIIIPFFLQI